MTFRIVQQGRPYCGNGGCGCRDDYMVPAVDFVGGRRVVGRTFLGV